MNPVVLHAYESPVPLHVLDRTVAVGLATLLAASTDLLSAFVHWGLRGVAPDAILRAVARWVIHEPLPAAPLVALAGFSTLLALYLPAAIALDACVARRPRLARSSMRLGVVWGLLTYVALFQIVVPLIVRPATLDSSAGWLATCIVVHAALIGPAAAWLIGQAHGNRSSVR